MTNSANVIRPRRNQPARGWLMIGGLLIVAATIPLTLMNKSGGLSLPEFGSLFGSNIASKSDAASKGEAKNKALKTSLQITSSNSAAYVAALDKAASRLNEQIAQSPASPSLQNRLGLVYLTLGDSKSAEQCFRNAVDFSRSGISICKDKLENLKKSGDMTGAEAILLEASEASVELSAAHANLARVYDQRGDRKAVMGELEQMNKDGLLLNGFAAGGAGLAGKDDVLSGEDAARLSEAEGLFKTNQLPQALQAYRKLAEKNSKLAFVFDRIGLISVMTGDLSSATDAWEEAAKLSPKSAAIQNNLGLAYHQLGMDKESESAFRKALKLQPGMEEAALNLADLESTKGGLTSAIAIMREAEKHNPKSARIANNMGTFLAMSGHPALAGIEFSKAIRLNANMASAHYGLGASLIKLKRYPQAIHELKTALLLNPRLHDAQAKIEEAQRAAGLRN